MDVHKVQNGNNLQQKPWDRSSILMLKEHKGYKDINVRQRTLSPKFKIVFPVC